MPVFIEATDPNAILVEHDPKLNMYFMEHGGVLAAGHELLFDTTDGKVTSGREVIISSLNDMGSPIMINGELVMPNRPVEVNGMRILGM